MKLSKSYLGALTALVLAGASATANAAFEDFTVQEGSVPGQVDNEIVADKLNGGYEESLTINPDFTIDFIGFVNFSAFFADEGTSLVPSQLAGLNGYNMYAIFEGSGTFNPVDGTFSVDTNNLTIFIDPDQNTVNSFNGGGAAGNTLAGEGEDYLIASASNVVSASGVIGVPGAFQTIWDDFALTAAGEDYFIAPRPFHMIVESTGDFDEDNFGPGDFTVTGDVSAIFQQVPEPSTLALMGLSLVVLGATLRRRQTL